MSRRTRTRLFAAATVVVVAVAAFAHAVTGSPVHWIGPPFMAVAWLMSAAEPTPPTRRRRTRR